MNPGTAKWLWEQALLWSRVCATSAGSLSDRNTFWFTGDDPSLGVQDDLEACALAAKRGDERAQRYMAKFMELRMKE